jgi:transcriptional regulator with XRE-family HTH domain
MRGRARNEKAHGTSLKDFGPRLRALRDKRGLTQEDVAQAIGATLMMISRYERGVHLPTAERIVALAQVLHVTADALLSGDRKGETPVPFENLRLFERMKVLDRLPRAEQNTVLDLVDAVIARHEIKGVAARHASP